MHQRRIHVPDVRQTDDSVQDIVIDCDQFSRVMRLRLGRGDDEGDTLPDMAHPISSQRPDAGANSFGPADVLGHDFGLQGTEAGVGPIVAGQDGVNARGLLGGGFVDAADAGAGVRRMDKDGVSLAGQINVGDKPPLSGQEPRIFFARDGLPDTEAHEFPPSGIS
jgi:hypothetical protein